MTTFVISQLKCLHFNPCFLMIHVFVCKQCFHVSHAKVRGPGNTFPIWDYGLLTKEKGQVFRRGGKSFQHREKWGQILWHSCHQEMPSKPTPIQTLGHVTCQCHIDKCEASRGLISAFALDLAIMESCSEIIML